jgi:hypothetical protein
MTKLLNLISPQLLLLETEEKELPEEFTVSERGYEFLKQRVEQLNKKAAKYKVPPLVIEEVGSEFIYIIRPEFKEMQFDPGVLDTQTGKEQFMMPVKQYKLRIKGEPPNIEGYEFIARLEHTPTGNFVYTSPKASVPNLPAEYKSMNQHCDVCHTNRDRNDTFVIKMLVDDPVRFPGKTAGELLVVGRNCLARFLPGISVSALVMWTKMIDAIRDDVGASQEMEGDGGGGGSGKYYEERDNLLRWIIATYLYTGRYVSKKQANMDAEAGKPTISTLQRALGEMHPFKPDPQNTPIYYKMKEEDFRQKVDALADEFDQWLPTKDFDKMAQEKADFGDFFSNLKLVSSEEFIRGNHFGFFSALFQLFLRDKSDIEKKKEATLAMASKPPSPVQFGPELQGKRLRDVAKEAKIKQLKDEGKDDKTIKKMIRGHAFGWDITVRKISEYEKTQTFSRYDSGIGYRMFFVDEYGNEFLWFSSTDLGMVEGQKYSIDGTIVAYETINKYSGRPQVRINRVGIVKNYQEPEQPVQPTPTEPPPVITPPPTPS